MHSGPECESFIENVVEGVGSGWLACMGKQAPGQAVDCP